MFSQTGYKTIVRSHLVRACIAFASLHLLGSPAPLQAADNPPTPPSKSSTGITRKAFSGKLVSGAFVKVTIGVQAVKPSPRLVAVPSWGVPRGGAPQNVLVELKVLVNEKAVPLPSHAFDDLCNLDPGLAVASLKERGGTIRLTLIGGQGANTYYAGFDIAGGQLMARHVSGFDVAGNERVESTRYGK